MLFLLLSPFFLPALSTIIEAMRNEVEEALAYARQAVYLARPRDMPEDVQTLLLEALRVTSVKLERLYNQHWGSTMRQDRYCTIEVGLVDDLWMLPRSLGYFMDGDWSLREAVRATPLTGRTWHHKV